MKKVVFYSLAFVMLIQLSACLKEPEKPDYDENLRRAIASVNRTQLEKDIQIIADTLDRRGIVAEMEPNGVYYVVHELGNGIKPQLSSAMAVKYRGRLLTTGRQFDQAMDEPVGFYLYGLIIGWQIALPLFPAGSKVTLYIPSGYGYGPSGSTQIPAHANLEFYIEIVEVIP